MRIKAITWPSSSQWSVAYEHLQDFSKELGSRFCADTGNDAQARYIGAKVHEREDVLKEFTKEKEIDTYCNIQILEAIKNREKRYAVTCYMG